jgi:hypothetical protein
MSPAHARFGTAVELDVLLLTHHAAKRPGDLDNRLKTLIDGLTRPQNPQQQASITASPQEPLYCLLDDDDLVQRVSVDSRRWYESADPDEVLVVITATLVLASTVGPDAPFSNLFLIL